MKLSTQSRYGVRAIFDIAYNSAHTPARIQDINRRQKIPLRYLEQIFQKLRKSGFVKSKRGPGGGYILKKDPSEISLGEIIRSVEGGWKLVQCIEDEKDQKRCHMYEKCVTRYVWKEAQEMLYNYFDSITIADLCRKARESKIKQEIGHQLSFSI